MSRERLYQLLEDHGFQRVHAETRPGRSVRSFPADRLPLSEPVRRFLRQVAPAGLYGHQLEALSCHLDGADVGLTTRTASGKSLVFYAAALEAVARNPRARILAIYPLKALGREQEARWVAAFRAAGWPEERVARIDGDVGHAGERMQRLRRASVLLATPDILHAWLLPNIGERPVWDFIRALRLIVVDEVHVYSGVFGSNAAFLFRRLEHLLALAGGRASYVVASATLREPLQHFQALFGRSFTLVDESFDTSGQHELELLLVRPPGTQELLSSVSAFLRDLVRHTEHRFIAFVDSRKQTELLATIVKRAGGEGGARAGAEGTAAAVPAPADPVPEEPEEEPLPGIAEDLARLHVLPYRAGLEEEDRAVIQDRLSAGTLRGIISTSALELGVDIPHLDLGILLGVPRSTTSLQQRMGRVGRHGPGTVVVINNGDLYSEMIFKQPDRILRLPLAEGALYLENQRIQYIHAMCLARPGGEHDQARAQAGLPETDAFDSPVNWPDGFVELCRRERAGETPPGLQPMKMEAGDTPHTTFPLRDVDSQFRIQLVQGWEREELGSVSHGQVMREAYPGAIYYYLTRPYRVVQVSRSQRLVKVRRERKYYTTRPLGPISTVRPYLSAGEVFRAKRWGDLLLVETQLQIQEKVEGYKERRGSTEVTERYPLPLEKGFFRQPAFTRYYYTTGVVLFHPALRGEVELAKLAERLYEAFLMVVPFDRQDVHYAAGQLGDVGRGPLAAGSRFVAIYDQTYGSLRLTGRLAEPEVAREVLGKALESVDVSGDLGPATVGWLQEAVRLTERETAADVPELLAPEAAAAPEPGDAHRVPVIMPGSVGLDQARGNEEFYVDGVFFNPLAGALYYRGRHASTPPGDPSLTIQVPVANVVPIPGQSRMGWYHLAEGTVSPEE